MLPEFHNFREACECIEAGGGVYRYGDSIGPGLTPYYKSDRWGVGCVRGRIWEHANFTVEQQMSLDWVLMSQEELEKQFVTHRASSSLPASSADDRRLLPQSIDYS